MFCQLLLTAFSKDLKAEPVALPGWKSDPISFMTGKYGKRSLKVLDLKDYKRRGPERGQAALAACCCQPFETGGAVSN